MAPKRVLRRRTPARSATLPLRADQETNKGTTCGAPLIRGHIGLMKIEVLADSESVAQRAASIIAEEARNAAEAGGFFVMAVSGGHAPWLMLRALAGANVPWPAIHIVQVDERVSPIGHPDRNLTHIRESLLDNAPLRAEQISAMHVESNDLKAAAVEYEETLR